MSQQSIQRNETKTKLNKNAISEKRSEIASDNLLQQVVKHKIVISLDTILCSKTNVTNEPKLNDKEGDPCPPFGYPNFTKNLGCSHFGSSSGSSSPQGELAQATPDGNPNAIGAIEEPQYIYMDPKLVHKKLINHW